LVVVFGHLYLSMNDDGSSGLFRTPISPFVTGPAAVVLFFVLSGFVLSLPYLNGSNQRYFPYAVRRVCRLYFPFAVAVLVSVVLFRWLGGHALPYLTDGVAMSWNAPLSSRDLASHFLMTGYPADATRLDPPIWSLIVEMRASLLFPLLVFIAVRSGWVGILLGIGLALASSKLKSALGDGSAVNAASLAGTLLLTTRYLVFFLFGIMCATRLQGISRLILRLPGCVHGAAVVVWLAATAVIASKGLFNHGYTDLFYGVFATYLIACCIASERLAKILLHRWCQWLGNVSFSLYLIHWPILLAAYYLLSGLVPRPVVLLAALPAIFVSAHVMERWVERPSHNLGKRISRQMESKSAAAPAAGGIHGEPESVSV
jgi:peptidoglycan/LPS O-acetylase OafA/YrhL